MEISAVGGVGGGVVILAAACQIRLGGRWWRFCWKCLHGCDLDQWFSKGVQVFLMVIELRRLRCWSVIQKRHVLFKDGWNLGIVNWTNGLKTNQKGLHLADSWLNYAGSVVQTSVLERSCVLVENTDELCVWTGLITLQYSLIPKFHNCTRDVLCATLNIQYIHAYHKMKHHSITATTANIEIINHW